MSISLCPPELLFLICEYAWNSDYSHLLPLVSKQFHDITMPLRYRSIAITKSTPTPVTIPKDLPAFHRVRHLYVSHAPSSASAWIDSLQAVADTLETLCVDLPSTHLLACVFRVRFPRLKELTMNGVYPFPGEVYMPELKRLHLAGHRNPHGLLNGQLVEGLEVLRISGVSGAQAFAREVSDALGRDGVRTDAGDEKVFDDDDEEKDRYEERTIPRSLKLVIIQLGPVLSSRKRIDDDMLRILRETSERDAKTGPRLAIIGHRLSSSRLEASQTMAMWRDGIDGKDSWQ